MKAELKVRLEDRNKVRDKGGRKGFSFVAPPVCYELSMTTCLGIEEMARGHSGSSDTSCHYAI
jgi:hypothetical protein